MRVAFIARYLQRVNHRKVEALAAQPKLELWHIAPRCWKDNFRTYEQDITQGQGYQLLLANAFPLRNDSHRFVYWPFTLFLNKIKPDIIHLEEEPDSLAALQAVIARRLWAPHARLMLFTWQNIYRQRRSYVERIARFVLYHTDYVIAGNQEAVDVLRRQSYTGPACVIPQLGVDVDTFKPQDATDLRRSLQLESFVAGYVGRFVTEKGLDTLLKAAAQIPDVQLLWVGRGPAQAELEDLAQALHLRQRLTIINSVPHNEVAHYLNAMDALILPSRAAPNWKEQFGHVLIEAMACGTPVIGSASGAIPEVIDSAGLTFPAGDEQALAAHLRRLSHSPDERQTLRARGFERVERCYSHARIAEQTYQAYQAVLQQH